MLYFLLHLLREFLLVIVVVVASGLRRALIVLELQTRLIHLCQIIVLQVIRLKGVVKNVFLLHQILLLQIIALLL